MRERLKRRDLEKSGSGVGEGLEDVALVRMRESRVSDESEGWM